MAIPVKLPVFEGPLDLLLHLIEKNKIDIYDIPIVEITDQYLEYVQAMEEGSMEVMSEFMVMAATLIDIKCRMLLPAEEEDTEEEDPRDELVQRLLEYKKYKYMSAVLAEKMDETGVVLTKETDLPDEVKKYRPPVDIDELLTGLTLEKLYKVYEDILKRNEERINKRPNPYGKIEKEKFSVTESMTRVQRKLIKVRKTSFNKLLEEQHSKTAVVITFLAVLELIHFKKIQVTQSETFGEIIIESLDPEGAEAMQFENVDLEMN